MSISNSRRARLALAASGVLVAAGLAPSVMAAAPAPEVAQAASAAPQQKQFESGTYIVELVGAPVVGYTGGIPRSRRHEAGARQEGQSVGCGG